MDFYFEDAYPVRDFLVHALNFRVALLRDLLGPGFEIGDLEDVIDLFFDGLVMVYFHTKPISQHYNNKFIWAPAAPVAAAATRTNTASWTISTLPRRSRYRTTPRPSSAPSKSATIRISSQVRFPLARR